MGKIIEINILYAAQDDIDIVNGKGWVSYFKKFLSMMLQQTSATSFKINLLSDAIEEEEASEGILISIMSPDFILSGICLDRLENFASKHEHDLDKTVFKVFKTTIDYVDVPNIVKALPSYEMFYTDEDNIGRAFHDFFTKEAEGNYWMKMVDLCFDIYEAILEQTNQPVSIETSKRKAIYLAETGQDLTGERNIIKRELIRHGFELFPKSNSWQGLSDLKSVIAHDLKQCTFSIHLIGASYGRLAKGSDISVMDLQNDIAASYAEEFSDFSRLIWISPALKSASEKQKSFIHNIKRDKHASAGAEVLHTSLEDFKNTLWEEILAGGLSRKLSKPNDKNIDRKPNLYLIYDYADAKHADKIKNQLEKENITLLELPADGELMELRNQHVAFLKQMDGAIVVQDAVNDQWVHMKLLDLLKAPGFGRNYPILGRFMVTSSAEKSRTLYEHKYQVNTALLQDQKALEKFINQISMQYKAKSSAIDSPL